MGRKIEATTDKIRAGDDSQRDFHGHFVEVGDQHLDTDEDQDGGEAVVEVVEQLHDAGQREVQRPQPQDRKHILIELVLQVFSEKGAGHLGGRDASAPPSPPSSSFAFLRIRSFLVPLTALSTLTLSSCIGDVRKLHQRNGVVVITEG